ncbi:MAG: hypothetical protein QME52_08080 [Bacteroidota bacterium]|nr:hypothetical protein [Bacteroidota bacterium]
MQHINLKIALSVGILFAVMGFGIPTNYSTQSKTYQTNETDTVQIVVNEGWNLISLPLIVPDGRVSVLFPSAISSAFKYEGRYIPCDTLEPGVGYWLKFAEEKSFLIRGENVYCKLLELQSGWNLIGVISYPIAIGEIVNYPEGNLVGDFFAYDSNSYYKVFDTLQPGKGYWIKAKQKGTLWISSVNTTPLLLLPIDSAINQSAFTIFRWSDDECKEYYHLQVAEDSNFTQIIFDDSLIAEPNHRVYLSYNSSYYWRVAAKYFGGLRSEWSSVWQLTTLDSLQWEFFGLEDETVDAIAVHPNDEKIIYVGTGFDFSAGHMGKLFKSTNSGSTWDTLIVGQPLFSFRDIVVDPIHPETVYTIPLPVLKSTNGGKTWFEIINGIYVDWETRVQSLAIDPLNTNILYCGTGGFFCGRFYKSTNGGESWRDIARGDTLAEGVVSIAIDPNNPNIVYAGTAELGRLWKTSDAGETWTLTGLGETGSTIDAVAVDPFNSNKVYARVRFMGLFKSSDGGTTWVKTQIPDSIGVFTILFSKLQPGTIYLATAYGCIIMSEGDNPYWFYLNEGLENFISKSLNTIRFYKNENYLLAGRTKGIGNGGIYFRKISN